MLLLLLLLLLLFPLDNSIRNIKSGYGSSKTGTIQEKVTRGRLFTQEGSKAEKVRYEDGKKEGQEMGKGIIQSYKWGLHLILAGAAGQ